MGECTEGSFDWYLISPLLKNFRRRENTLRMVANMVSVVMEDMSLGSSNAYHIVVCRFLSLNLDSFRRGFRTIRFIFLLE